MEISMLLGQQIIVIVMMILIGYAAGKTNLIDSETSVQLSRTVLYVISPCMFIDAFQQEFSVNKLKGFLLTGAAAIVIHIVVIWLARVISRRFRLKVVAQASVIYTNCGNLLVPIIGYILGNEYVLYCSAFIVVQTTLMWTHGFMLISGDKTIQWKKILLNPNIIAIVVGMVLFFANISLPSYLASAVSRIGDCIGPISMLVIGILISQADLKAVFTDKASWFVTLVRLFVCPAIYILLLKICQVNLIMPEAKEILLVSFLAEAAPAAASVSQFANILHKDEALAGSINVMTMLLCMATMPLMTVLYQMIL